MASETEFGIQIIKLVSPVYVAGQEVRVKHGTPECFPTISTLCNRFLSEDIPSKIQNKIDPIIRFGMCIDHIYMEDIIEFTYITGVQIKGPIKENTMPELVKCYSIPTGEYACIKVTSPDGGTTIGIAYTQLDKWINESQEWESTVGEYEVYPKFTTNAEMELWRPVRRKYQ